MCGIVGFFGQITDSDALSSYAMSEAIRHRGTDWTAKFSSDDCCLQFNALPNSNKRISDKPLEFTFEDKSYAAVFDGEIYNFDGLKQSLGIKTESQLELVCALYHKHGRDFVKQLKGMFALAVYDKQTAKLLVARDIMGAKPMYYLTADTTIVFASELKAFMHLKDYAFAVDKTQLQHYMTFQYVTEPDTITKGIKILPPGSYIECTIDSARVNTTITEYKRFYFRPDATISYDEKKKRLRTAVENAVGRHIPKDDTNISTFLSSGIDSAIITSLASRIKPGIKAFTIGFENDGNNEIDNASQLAKLLDVEHIKLNCTLQDFVDSFESTIYHLDGPVADPSTVAINLICGVISKHSNTVLSGEGADELFGGYRQYADSIPTGKIYGLPKGVKNVLGFIASMLPDNVKGKGLIQRGVTPIEQRYTGHSFVFGEAAKKKLLVSYDPNVKFTDRTAELYAKCAAYPNYTRLLMMQDCDLRTWATGDIFVKGDRLSMAHSLEMRMPYIDNEVMEIAALLCDGEKLSHNTTKYILRDTFSDVVNQETAIRPKLGYPVPVRKWLSGELYEWAKSIIENSTADEFIVKAEALKLLEIHKSGKQDLYHQIWTLLTFITWHKLFVADTEATKQKYYKKSNLERN